MGDVIHILHLEDDAADAELVHTTLESANVPCRIAVVQTRDGFAEALQAKTYDVILADYRLPTFDGMSALRRAREHCPDIPFIFVSGTMGEDAAIEGLTEGATDYVLKQKLSRLVPAVKRALGEVADRRRRRQAEEALKTSEERFRALFENSPVPMWEEDFSAVKSLLDGLREKGVVDLECYLNEHLEVLHQCVERVQVTDFNQAAMKMHRAGSRKELLRGLAGTFAPESYATFQRELLCLWNGETEMVTDGVVQTLDGDQREVTLYWSVMPGHEPALSEVLVSIVDITERKRAEEEIREHQAQLRALASELSRTEEREKRRLALQLHDSVGQDLAVTKFALQRLSASCGSPDVAAEIDRVCKEVDRTIDDVRSLTSELSSPILYEVGLTAALESWLEKNVHAKHGITYAIEADEGVGRLELDTELRVVLFRAIRELVVNVVKHARAEHVHVRVHKRDDQVRVTVEDDGVGFSGQPDTGRTSRTGGFGLFSIREQLGELDGDLTIVSEPGRGACVRMTVPIK